MVNNFVSSASKLRKAAQEDFSIVKIMMKFRQNAIKVESSLLIISVLINGGNSFKIQIVVYEK